MTKLKQFFLNQAIEKNKVGFEPTNAPITASEATSSTNVVKPYFNIQEFLMNDDILDDIAYKHVRHGFIIFFEESDKKGHINILFNDIHFDRVIDSMTTEVEVQSAFEESLLPGVYSKIDSTLYHIFN